EEVPGDVDDGRKRAVTLDPLLEPPDVLDPDHAVQSESARRDDAGRDHEQEDDGADPAALHRVHRSHAAKSFLTVGVRRVRLNMSPVWRMASACVGYG